MSSKNKRKTKEKHRNSAGYESRTGVGKEKRRGSQTRGVSSGRSCLRHPIDLRSRPVPVTDQELWAQVFSGFYRPDSVRSVRFGSILGIECVRERKQNKNIETRLPSGWTAGPSSVRETGKMQTRVWREQYGTLSITEFQEWCWFATMRVNSVSVSLFPRGSVPSSSRQKGGNPSGPGPRSQEEQDETKCEKKVETEKLGHRGRTGKESDPIGHVSRSFVRSLARSRQRPVSGGSIAVHTRTSSRDVRKG